MASFSESGLNGLNLSLKELMELPDSVAGEMLSAEGRIVAAAQKRSIQGAGLVDSGQLVNSITVNAKVKKKSGTRYIAVYPKGKRKGKKAASNSEVAFINEFGAPKRGIPAKQWMRTANDGCADEAVRAAEQVYDRWLKSKGF